MIEADLYLPVKKFLENQGYTVKGEIKDCDVVAIRGDTTVIVEIKLIANLKLLYQANNRKAVTDDTYIALPDSAAVLKRAQYRDFTRLLRLLGIGLLIVSPATGMVSAVLDPASYSPRRRKQKKAALIKEFHDLVGDPNTGGSSRRQGRMTAYRQRTLNIANYLIENGATKASQVKDALEDEGSRSILYRNVYGWFEAHGKGIYSISPRGVEEVRAWLGK